MGNNCFFVLIVSVSASYQRSERTLVVVQLCVSSSDEAADVFIVSKTQIQEKTDFRERAAFAVVNAHISPAPNVGLHSLASIRPNTASEPQPR